MTSWHPTLPRVRAPHVDVAAATISASAGGGAAGLQVLVDPFFNQFSSGVGVPYLSTSSPTRYRDFFDQATTPTAWYTPTATTEEWIRAVSTAHLYDLNVLQMQTSAPPVLRPRAYDSTSNPVGGFAAMVQPGMYYEFGIDMRVSSVTSTPTAGVQMRFANWNASTHAVGSTAEMIALATTYKRLSMVGTVPDVVPGSTNRQAIHLVPEIITDGTTVERTWYFANPSLTLQAKEPLNQYTITQSGVLSTSTGALKIPFISPGTITATKAAVGTSPTGSAISIDVNRNGTSIYASTSTTGPTISTGTTVSANATPDPTTMAIGDYLTVDIDAVGSSTPGSDLTVVIEWRS